MNRRNAVSRIICCLPASACSYVSESIAVWGDSFVPRLVGELNKITNGFVFDGGVSGNTSTQVLARQAATQKMRDWISVFWYGRNNYGYPDQVKANLNESVAMLSPGNGRFVILSVLNSARQNEQVGGMGYAAILRLNSDLAKIYPNNFIDARKILVNNYKIESMQDTVDFWNDVVPASFRYDLLHLNDEGSRLIACEVIKFIRAKGWIV